MAQESKKIDFKPSAAPAEAVGSSAAAAVAPAAPAAPGKEPALVYVGPAMRKGDMVLGRFQTLRGSLSAALKARIERDLDFARLFVAPGDLAGARKKLNDRSTMLARSFQAVYTSMIKGGK